MRSFQSLLFTSLIALCPQFALAYTLCNQVLTPAAQAGFERALPSVLRVAKKIAGTSSIESVCPYYANDHFEKAVWVEFTNQKFCKIWLNENWTYIYTSDSYCGTPYRSNSFGTRVR